MSQALFDAMFGDMDRGLREMGAGDLGVGRRVKDMAKAFYGRVAAYEMGLDSPDYSLDEAVLRNVFRGDEDRRQAAHLIAGYIERQWSALNRQPIDAFLKGTVAFADIGHDTAEAP